MSTKKAVYARCAALGVEVQNESCGCENAHFAYAPKGYRFTNELHGQLVGSWQRGDAQNWASLAELEIEPCPLTDCDTCGE